MKKCAKRKVDLRREMKTGIRMQNIRKQKSLVFLKLETCDRILKYACLRKPELRFAFLGIQCYVEIFKM